MSEDMGINQQHNSTLSKVIYKSQLRQRNDLK